MLVDGPGRVPFDLQRKRGGEILGVVLRNPLAQGHQRRSNRTNRFAGTREFEAVLYLSRELIEVHGSHRVIVIHALIIVCLLKAPGER